MRTQRPTVHSAELLVDIRSQHGEGPVWDPVRQRLFWVDLLAGKLHTLDPEIGRVESRYFAEPICAVAPSKDGRMLVAFAKRLAYLDWATGAIDEIVRVEPDKPTNRCNDGKLDPAGRFWIGTMSADGGMPAAGGLHRLDGDGTLELVLPGLTIANGLAWSRDARTMYFIDSPTREIWAFDFDGATSRISGQRTVVRTPPSLGVPDGMTIDADGMLWVAQWGGGCVCRWNPLSGDLLATVMTGCTHTTSCAWGGAGGTDLFITTSRLGLSSDTLRATPNSGGLFRFRLPGASGPRMMCG